MYLNSKNDIPIKDQNAVEKPLELPFNGLSSSVLRTRRPERSEQSEAKA
ncbi:hypothetical protein [Kaistella haifensis]|nr:hypothetical protein [Kaistella haifensis]